MNKKQENTGGNTSQSLAMLGLTSATWAHRLGNTLGLFRNWTDEIKNNLDNKENVLLLLDKIQEEINNQLKLANELTNFSRLSAGSEYGPVSVNSIVTKTYKAHFDQKNVNKANPKFILRFEKNLPDVRADEPLLEQVLYNLINNAISAVKGNEKGYIILETKLLNNLVVIDISDNGIGFSPEKATKIFQAPMISTEKTGGLGIGLFISQALVNSWNGRLIVIPNDNSVTTLRIELPFWKSSTTIDSARRAIIVDDNRNWRELLTTYLSNRDITIDSAASISEAMILLKNHEYDLALLDMRLNSVDENDLTGLSIAKLLRERNPDALIAIFTGFPTADTVRYAFTAGVDDFIAKSHFSIDDLDKILDKVAVRRESERESIRQSQLNKLMYEILSMISHELRAPLLTVQRNAEALSLGSFGTLTSDQLLAVNTILSAVDREFILLNAHLDLNRIERGAERLDYHEYDLVTLVREEVNAHTIEATRKGVMIQANFPKKKAKVQIDVNRFRVVLNPLLDNAIKFSPENSKISVAVQLKKEYVEVLVSDHGPGIKPNELDLLVNPRTVDAMDFTQRIRGSGLGLSMAKRMIELHGGTMWIESDGKCGTTVGFRLPIKRRDTTNVL